MAKYNQKGALCLSGKEPLVERRGGRGTRTPKPLLATVFKTVGLPLSYSSGAEEKYVLKWGGSGKKDVRFQEYQQLFLLFFRKIAVETGFGVIKFCHS